jgi:hypothetical protein
MTPATQAERRLVEAASSGETIDLHSGIGNRREQLVRGTFLRALLNGRVLRSSAPLAHSGEKHSQDEVAPTEKGIEVASPFCLSNAWIAGIFDLSRSGTAVHYPFFEFSGCIFWGGLDLSSINAAGLVIRDSYVLNGDLLAEDASLRGGVRITDTVFTAGQIVSFRGAFIDFSFLLRNLSARESGGLLDKLGTFIDAFRNDAPPPEAEEAQLELGADLERWRATAPQSLRALRLNLLRVTGDCELAGIRLSNPTFPGATPQPDHLEPGIALDLSSARIKGGMILGRTEIQPCAIAGAVCLQDAAVDANVTFQGVAISNSSVALDLERASIKGSVSLQPANGCVCSLDGKFNLLGAKIGGQLLLKGAVIRASKEDEQKRALVADGVEVGGDVHFRSTTSAQRTEIDGLVRFNGCAVRGELAFMSCRIAAENMEAALEVANSTIAGGMYVVAGGRRNDSAPVVEILGGIRLDGSHFGLSLFFRRVRLTPGNTGVALSAFTVKVGRDFEILQCHPNQGNPRDPTKLDLVGITGSIHIAGTTVESRLRFLGVKIITDKDVAILASGVKVSAGLYFGAGRNARQQENEFPKNIATEIQGSIRINGAVIGSRLEMQGVQLNTGLQKPDIAIWANGIEVNGDVNFVKTDLSCPCSVFGELRFIGARVSGELVLEGGIFNATGSGAALDCYNAEIAKGIRLAPVGGASEPLEILGIVGAAYSKLGSFTAGPLLPNSANAPAVGVVIQGYLRLTGTTVKDVTSIERCVLQSAETLAEPLRSNVQARFDDWQVFDAKAVLGLDGADLGSFASVYLDSKSLGLVDLTNARVTTLRDMNGRGWGLPPAGPGWASLASHSDRAWRGVRLKLNGFTYDHFFEEDQDHTIPASHTWWHRLQCRFRMCVLWLTPNNRRSKVRLQWIARQHPNGVRTRDSFEPMPYIQLANVFRNHGYSREADTVSCFRRTCNVLYGSIGQLDRALQWAYGTFFGFGYQSKRALLTVLLLIAFQWGYLEAGSAVGPNKGHPWLMVRPSANPVTGMAPPPSQPACDGWVDCIFVATGRMLHIPDTRPVILTEEKKHPWLRFDGIALEGISWVVLSAALLTFTGILRESNK